MSGLAETYHLEESQDGTTGWKGASLISEYSEQFPVMVLVIQVILNPAAQSNAEEREGSVEGINNERMQIRFNDSHYDFMENRSCHRNAVFSLIWASE